MDNNTRDVPSVLPGRVSTPSPGRKHTEKAKRRLDTENHRPRLDDKHQQVASATNATDYVTGDGSRHIHHDHKTSLSSHSEAQTERIPICYHKDTQTQPICENNRYTKNKKRTTLVEGPKNLITRGSNTQLPSTDHANNRCFGDGLESSIQRTTNQPDMESGRKTLTYQHLRDGGCHQNHKPLQKQPTRQECQTNDGQHHGVDTRQKPRRHGIQKPHKANDKMAANSIPVQDNIHSPSHCIRSQCPSRPSKLPKSDTQSRMTTPSISVTKLYQNHFYPESNLFATR